MLIMQLSWQALDKRETLKVAKSECPTRFKGLNTSRNWEECGCQITAA